eukprot:CAMPEP_0119560324 /NCGR_PEP_ID=MMETSP1352-20130426/14589_1 /TAXON_ID=265584 /ORGANISM="Stauroneis constricta, Strain CCMP1120" /LENGTH=181 /DNA_ID=CAMNT_0007608283 /DNA_START=193 /DNA_END=739 /DNA_ORIENTATION=-
MNASAKRLASNIEMQSYLSSGGIINFHTIGSIFASTRSWCPCSLMTLGALVGFVAWTSITGSSVSSSGSTVDFADLTGPSPSGDLVDLGLFVDFGDLVEKSSSSSSSSSGDLVDLPAFEPSLGLFVDFGLLVLSLGLLVDLGLLVLFISLPLNCSASSRNLFRLAAVTLPCSSISTSMAPS